MKSTKYTDAIEKKFIFVCCLEERMSIQLIDLIYETVSQF